jgi:uncharacterized protein
VFKLKVIEKKDKIIELFKSEKISFAGIFGSVARDEDTTESDVDFYIKFIDNSNTSLLDVVRIENELAKILNRKVDVVTNPNSFVLNSINKDLIKIYQYERKGL